MSLTASIILQSEIANCTPRMRHQQVPCGRSACFNSRDNQDSVRDNVTRCTRVRDVLHPGENDGTLSLNLNARCVQSTYCVVVDSSVALQRYMVLVFRDRCTYDECASHRYTEDQEVSHMIEGGPGCGSSRRLISTVDVLGIEGRDVRTAQRIRRKRNFFATCLKRFCKHQLCTNTKRDTARGHFVLWLPQTWHRAVARQSHGDFKTWEGVPTKDRRIGPHLSASRQMCSTLSSERILSVASTPPQPFTPRSAHRLLLSKMDEGASRHLCAQRAPQ